MYKFNEIEKKQQDKWKSNRVFVCDVNTNREKYYVLEMFAYPSGNLHMGHVRNYSIGDAIARYKRMLGKEVLHPFGWDSFGLPAEQAAIARNLNPKDWTESNISNMKAQMDILGFSYDWDREVVTSSPEYYRWNQWIFSRMLDKGLAYKSKSYVNWSNSLNTVLANEQVESAFLAKDASDITRKELEQWFFRITLFADDLLDMSALQDWPEKVLTMQKNWIDRREGYEVEFEVPGFDSIKLFIEDLSSLSSAAFVSVTKEHSFVRKLAEKDKRIREYIESIEKESLFSRHYAINPINSERIPILISEKDEIYTSYSESSLFEKFDIDIEKRDLEDMEAVFKKLEHLGFIKKVTHYRLKDWLISRQRYWGTPIPVVYNNGIETEDFVALPEDVEFNQGNPLASSKTFRQDKDRELDTMDTFVDSSWYYLRYLDPKNDNMPFDPKLAEAWPVDIYIGGVEHAVMHLLYARFMHRVFKELGLLKSREPFKKLVTQGMVVSNSYYSNRENRYYTEREYNTLSSEAKQDFVVTMEKMSKSKNNGIAPEEIVAEYGADATRLFILFAAPVEKDLEWNESGLIGTKRFLNRVWNLFKESSLDEQEERVKDQENLKEDEKNSLDKEVTSLEELLNNSRKRFHQLSDDQKNRERDEFLYTLHSSIKRVTEALENTLALNVAIAAIMELTNACYEKNIDESLLSEAKETLLKLLSPFAPHICDELSDKLLIKEDWPKFEQKFLEKEEFEIAVQVNGKIRASISIRKSDKEDSVIQKAKSIKNVEKYLNGDILKEIYIPGKIVNFVVKN